MACGLPGRLITLSLVICLVTIVLKSNMHSLVPPKKCTVFFVVLGHLVIFVALGVSRSFCVTCMAVHVLTWSYS